MRTESTDRRKGSALIEFSLSTLIWVPLLLGTFIVGLNLIRALQATQISRDAARLYAYGTDFSTAQAQNILTQKLAAGFDMSANGNAGIIFSTILLVGDSECTANGRQADTTDCPNLNQYVFTRSIRVGNSSLLNSSYGNATGMNASGNIAASTYLTNTGDRASAFGVDLPMTPGQSGFVTELYISSKDINWPGVAISPGVYERAIF